MQDLERLFGAYRDSLPDPEPSAGFTPGIWRRIEARRSPVRMFRRVSEALVAVAALIAVLIAVFVIPQVQKYPVYSATYVDVLVAEQPTDAMPYQDVLHLDPAQELPK